MLLNSRGRLWGSAEGTERFQRPFSVMSGEFWLCLNPEMCLPFYESDHPNFTPPPFTLSLFLQPKVTQRHRTQAHYWLTDRLIVCMEKVTQSPNVPFCDIPILQHNSPNETFLTPLVKYSWQQLRQQSRATDRCMIIRQDQASTTMDPERPG